ncbi:hypothetical protein Aduo_006341 [Ancylostoma duodenale]
MDRDHDHQKEESKLYKWRKTSSLANFGTSRQRPFLAIEADHRCTLTSSEKESIHNFVSIYKNIWLALQQISHKHSSFDKHTKLRAAGFLYVLRLLKFFRYVIYQLQLLDIISTLSKSAQLPTSTLWQTQQQLDKTIPTIKHSADSPNDYEMTKPFLEMVLCKRATSTERFRHNALNQRCATW